MSCVIIIFEICIHTTNASTGWHEKCWEKNNGNEHKWKYTTPNSKYLYIDTDTFSKHLQVILVKLAEKRDGNQGLLIIRFVAYMEKRNDANDKSVLNLFNWVHSFVASIFFFTLLLVDY